MQTKDKYEKSFETIVTNLKRLQENGKLSDINNFAMVCYYTHNLSQLVEDISNEYEENANENNNI